MLDREDPLEYINTQSSTESIGEKLSRTYFVKFEEAKVNMEERT